MSSLRTFQAHIFILIFSLIDLDTSKVETQVLLHHFFIMHAYEMEKPVSLWGHLFTLEGLWLTLFL